MKRYIWLMLLLSMGLMSNTSMAEDKKAETDDTLQLSALGSVDGMDYFRKYYTVDLNAPIPDVKALGKELQKNMKFMSRDI